MLDGFEYWTLWGVRGVSVCGGETAHSLRYVDGTLRDRVPFVRKLLRFDNLRLREIERQLLRYATVLKTHLKKVNIMAIGIFRESRDPAKSVKTLIKKQV